MTSLSDDIISLFKEGEGCASSGRFHDAIISYQKAKAILISEPYDMFQKSK